eukprot:9718380-Ditylum_brightwellii.AAC.1
MAESLSPKGSSLIRKSSSNPSNRKVRGGDGHDVIGIGSSVDLLAPVVFFTREYNEIIMSGQSPKLAEGWQLGAWWHTGIESNDVQAIPNETKEEEKKTEAEHNISILDDEEWGWSDAPSHVNSDDVN